MYSLGQYEASCYDYSHETHPELLPTSCNAYPMIRCQRGSRVESNYSENMNKIPSVRTYSS